MNKFIGLLRPTAQGRLGPLEQELLEALWRRNNATVRELIGNGDSKLAYTTVMTTLDRLYKKNLLSRTAEGRAFRYEPRYSPEQLQKEAAGEMIRELLVSNEASALPLSYLVEAVSEHDAQLLDQLQELIERKRRELQGSEKI